VKTLVIMGSRNPEGKTAEAAKAIVRGVTDAGGETETVFLTALKLQLCQQCEQDGWGKCRSEGVCILKDDFDTVCEKVAASDVVIFANPVYFMDLSESMRAFLDRYRRVTFPKVMAAGPGGAPDKKTAVALCYAGGSGNGTTACAANMERILQICNFDVVDVIPCRRQNLEAKLPMLEYEGRWLATVPKSGDWVQPESRK
jgi:multimeric flavodoxin WrbA